MIYNFSSINEESTSIPDLRAKACLTELELDLALTSLPRQNESNKFWFCVRPAKPLAPIASRPSGKRLTLEACLSKLKLRFELPPLAVLDALQSSHRLRLDRSKNNLYLSLLSFSFSDSNEGIEEEHKLRKAPTLRSSSFEWMGFSSSSSPHMNRSGAKTHHGECSTGTLADLVHRGIPTSSTETISKVHNIAHGSVGWQRVCFFLNEEAVITVFRDESEEVIEEVSDWFAAPELHLLELSKGVDFLCHVLIKNVVGSMDEVMTSYRLNLLELEEAAFVQVGLP